MSHVTRMHDVTSMEATSACASAPRQRSALALQQPAVAAPHLGATPWASSGHVQLFVPPLACTHAQGSLILYPLTVLDSTRNREAHDTTTDIARASSGEGSAETWSFAG